MHSARIRYSNFNSDDDASLDVRGCALKLSDSLEEAPLDLLFATGKELPYCNLDTFSKYMSAQNSRGDEKMQSYIFDYPFAIHSLIEQCKRAPACYTDLHYYALPCLEFIALDGIKRYCRFRIVSFGDGIGSIVSSESSGLPDLADQISLLYRNLNNAGVRRLDEKRAKNYLKSVLEEKISSQGAIKLRLQIQFREWTDAESYEVFNPAMAWEENDFPFFDIGLLEFNSILAEEECERLQFNVSRLPRDTLFLLKAVSIKDYNSINFARHEIYEFFQALRLGLTNTIGLHEGNCKYVIRLHTGELFNARSFGRISVKIVGSLGETTTMIFPPPLQDLVTHVVFNRSVGEPLTVHVGHDGPGYAGDWYCEGVYVWAQGSEATGSVRSSGAFEHWFPCYGWVIAGATHTLFHSDRSIPQRDLIPAAINDRELYLSHMRQLWRWDGGEALPQHSHYLKMSEIPRTYQFSSAKKVSFGLTSFESAINAAAAKLACMPKDIIDFFEKQEPSDLEKHFHATLTDPNERFSSLYDIHKLFETIQIPKIPPKLWKSDVEFGRRMLNGANPVLIKRCNSIPSNFGVTPEMVQSLMPEGSDLLTELASGYVYIADCACMDGLKLWDADIAEVVKKKNKNNAFMISNLPRYMSPAMALFHVSRSGQLLPIAIQLQQELGSPVWTPLDTPEEWLFAKLFYKVADHNFHQMITHLLETHLISESFIIGALRQIAPCHPVMKLLHHHIKGCIPINTFGRDVLLGPGGAADISLALGGGAHTALMSKWYLEHWDYLDFPFPSRIIRKGLDDKTKLPGYYYRDDGLAIWDIIYKYVKRFLSLHYKSDEEVLGDTEVQGWIKDMHDHGMCKAKNVPECFTTIDDVALCISSLLWQVSAGHAAVNYSQFEQFSFSPFFPSAALIPIPDRKGLASMSKLFDEFLPTAWMCAASISSLSILCQFSPDDKMLGDYPDKIFSSDEEKMALQFKAEVSLLSISIANRNSAIESKKELTFDSPYDVPYVFLDPNRVPNSVAI